jgi:hypothetical protein
MNKQIEVFLEDQLPSKYQAHIPAALTTAYATAAHIAKAEPIFSMESARANHGRLVSWATDFAVLKLIESGVWPYDYEWISYNKPTGRYLSVKLPLSTLSISQVNNYKIPPRKVGFRGNAALSNQSYIFQDMEEERKRIVDLPSFILCHGHQKLNFAHIGMSDPEQNYWMYRTENLLTSKIHTLEAELPPVEVSEESVLTLKEDIMKWRRDQNE